MPTSPILLVHGGAWAMPDADVAAHEHGIMNALTAGWTQITRGGTALDAVQAAVASMEDDDTFDAGRGSFLTRDGRVQMDALLMNGANLRTGGVACVERLRNPIHAARLVLDHSPHVYFVGTGAERFARQHGMALIDNTELIVPRERNRLMQFQQAELAGSADTTFSGAANSAARLDSGALSTESQQTSAPERPKTIIDPAIAQADLAAEAERALPNAFQILDPILDSHDTVGAVAIDAHGDLAAATSTGGTLSKAPGRVGDSSLIGCGCYADNLSAAVSLTGWGEPIMKLVLGKWAVDRVAAGSSPQHAATAAINYLFERLSGHGGIILLGPDGRFGLAHNTPRMAWGMRDSNGMKVGVDLH